MRKCKTDMVGHEIKVEISMNMTIFSTRPSNLFNISAKKMIERMRKHYHTFFVVTALQLFPTTQRQ